MNPFLTIKQGTSPLILSIPHAGTMLPPDITVALNDLGRSVPDTDWWIDRLYAPLAKHFDASIVMTHLSRTVIDVNRGGDGASLYPGQNTTPLCATTTFDNQAIYRVGCEPDTESIDTRKTLYYQPFHDALQTMIQTVNTRHGHAVLYDCHSIRSVVPFLFEGALPTLNLGTFGGVSCSPSVQMAAERAMAQSGLSTISNGRFKGGFITRNYGCQKTRIEALQMEIAQSAYMDEAPPWTWNAARAATLQKTLATIIEAVLAAAHTAHSTR